MWQRRKPGQVTALGPGHKVSNRMELQSPAVHHVQSYIRLESALYVKTLDFISQVISFQLRPRHEEACFRNIHLEAKCKINLISQKMTEEGKLLKDY